LCRKLSLLFQFEELFAQEVSCECSVMRLYPIVVGLAFFSGAWRRAFGITNHASALASQLRGGFDGQAWLDAFHQHQGGHATNVDVASKKAVITRALQS
jgi:hypothetical protein